MSTKFQVSKSRSFLYSEVRQEHFYPLIMCVSQTSFEFKVPRKISLTEGDEGMGLEEVAS